MDYKELAKQFIEDGAWDGVPAIAVRLFAQWLEEHEAAEHRVQADLLPCGHSSDNLGNFGGCNPMGSCVICDAATSR